MPQLKHVERQKKRGRLLAEPEGEIIRSLGPFNEDFTKNDKGEHKSTFEADMILEHYYPHV